MNVIMSSNKYNVDHLVFEKEENVINYDSIIKILSCYGYFLIH